MKRCLPLLLLAILLLSACGKQAKTVSAIDEANNNCDTLLHLAMPETDLEEQSGYMRVEIWGGWTLENEDVRYTFSGYPDVLGDYHLTEIELLSEKHHFYGITLNDDFQTAISNLESFGYEKDAQQSASYSATVLLKDNIRFIIYSFANSISNIKLQVITTNVENVSF